MLDLQEHITKLTRIFQRWSGARELPAELKTRIATFFEWVHIPLSHTYIYHCHQPTSDLAGISTQFHDLISRGTVRRFFSAAEDAAKLSGLIRDIDRLIQSFQVSMSFHSHGALSDSSLYSARWHCCY